MKYDDNKKEVELQAIASLIQYPEIFADIDGIVKENFFSIKLNEVIFSVIKNSLLNKEPLDKFTIANKINKLGIKFEVDVYDFLESLELRQVSKIAAPGYFRELAEIYAKKQIDLKLDEIRKYLNHSKNDSFDQVISKCDSLYGDVINSFSADNQPQDLFAGAEDYIEGISNDAECDEIICPYPKYQANYGGWFPGDLVVFVSPPKSGKSTLLLDILIKITQNDDNIKALMLDTELETYRVMRRMVSNISGVHEILLKRGTWRNNEITYKKVRSIWPIIKKYFSKIDHIYIGNASFEEQQSIIRRWHWKNISNTNKKAIVAIDYFKLTKTQGITDAYSGSMTMGYAVDSAKKLASELQCPILSAAQANANDETGLSKEVNKFASSVFLFKRKNLEDIALEGGKSTHKLIPMFTRDVGLEYDSIDTVKILKDKRDVYVPNHINFHIDSFKVTEMNTLAEQMNLQFLSKKSSQKSAENLF